VARHFLNPSAIIEDGQPKRGPSPLVTLRIGIARLLVRLFGIFGILAGSLALLAGFLTAALLLTWLLTRCLILLAGLVWVRHVVSFHGNIITTTESAPFQ
jgi:hypothetical protein